MNKRLFYLLVLLMSLSLIGIIFVQGYWIKNTVEINEQQFSFNANQTLLDVVDKLEIRELQLYYFAFKDVVDSLDNPKDVSFAEFFKIQQDDFNSGSFIYSDELDDEDFKLSESFSDKVSDSVRFASLVKNQAVRLIDNNDSSAIDVQMSDEHLKELMGMNRFEKEYVKRLVQGYASNLPIHRRVPKNLLSLLLSNELEQRNLATDFEYGIYSNSLATKVRSENFELKSNATYGVPLFTEQDKNGGYQLFVNFSGKNKLILSSITLMSALSIIFTLIIIVAYISALSQLIRQRQISEIKTDFINNMTHEFKTPIATMRLALDFLNNPKARGNEMMLTKYLSMIREENRRMNDQVENILQISRLEKNDLDIQKEPIQFHELIDSAVGHITLLVEQGNGYVKKHLGALNSRVLANESHFTNVLVNILENAVKYTDGPPKIDIYTENVKKELVIKIRDQGLGMNKKTRQNIFKKFYRAHTGDVHDVKGHGLGLAYSKRIVEEHYGTISVESEKDKGSTFIITLPLIK